MWISPVSQRGRAAALEGSGGNDALVGGEPHRPLLALTKLLPVGPQQERERQPCDDYGQTITSAGLALRVKRR